MTAEDIDVGPRESTSGYTADGRGVLLHEDGTWEFSGYSFVVVEDDEWIDPDEFRVSELVSVVVKEIVDGDTITVAFDRPPPGVQKEERIRLLGVDAPELNNRGGPEPFAIEARAFVATRIDGAIVRLAFESKWRDDFGRILAYVFLSDGSFINEELISTGLAAIYAGKPSFWHEHLVELEFAARLKSIGIWTVPISGKIAIRQIFNLEKAEYVELRNLTDQQIDLSGWYILDEKGNRIDIPAEAYLAPGASISIVSGPVEAQRPDILRLRPNSVRATSRQIWDNKGDVARVFDDSDALVAMHRYGDRLFARD